MQSLAEKNRSDEGTAPLKNNRTKSKLEHRNN